ncbi:hypothetical protein SISSUDRAFT_1055730 [Sistotremastrum suecicum HHB10207 ss-3]|uniref:F-box domain-containing protein n=1 Tax=Sistotremastrum suecicum HHB10207 ss-3 TaxID=1314776 RepID=A0A165XKF4_9AGAM|nr:hypothetical protein SISSUDRAFT_1055730 [Sistotremastrum suecicum HHB10207 ss-3]
MCDAVSAELVEMIGGFPKLKDISLSTPLFSSVVVSSLSKLPQLVTLSQNSQNITIPMTPGIDYKVIFPPSNFANLSKLKLDVDMDYLTQWITSGGMLSSLTSLHVALRALETKDKTRKCFALLAKAWPRIVELTFDMFTHTDIPSGKVCDVSIETFQPLLALSLSSFVFDHPDPLLLCDSDVGKLVMSWPKLRIFSLGKSCLYHENQVTLTLGVLNVFAEHNSHLESLSLVLDAAVAPSRELSDEVSFGPQFQALNLGCSPIQEIGSN